MQFSVLQLTTPSIKFNNCENIDCSISQYLDENSSNTNNINIQLTVNFHQDSDIYTEIVEYIKQSMKQKLVKDTILINTQISPVGITICMPSKTIDTHLKRNKDKQICWKDGTNFTGNEKFTAHITFELAITYYTTTNDIAVVSIYIYKSNISISSINWNEIQLQCYDSITVDTSLNSQASIIFCGICNKKFKGNNELRRHTKTTHNKSQHWVCTVVSCNKYNVPVYRLDNFKRHCRTEHPLINLEEFGL